MRSALVGALLCGVAIAAAAQEREVTFEEPQPVTVTGFAVGDASYDRVARSNTFTAGKIGVNLITTNSFNFTYARPSKLTGVQVHYTASSRLDIWGVAANGWDVAADNNRGKTALGRAQVIPIPWVTVGVTGVYGPERDSTDAHQRSLLSGDITVDRGPLILGAELNFGREQNGGANPTWRGGAATVFLRVARGWGLTARYDQLEDSDGLLTGTPQILRSVTVGPMWYLSSAREGIFSNIEHTRFHLPQIALRGAIRADWSTQPFFTDAAGGLQGSDTRAVLELVYIF